VFVFYDSLKNKLDLYKEERKRIKKRKRNKSKKIEGI